MKTTLLLLVVIIACITLVAWSVGRPWDMCSTYQVRRLDGEYHELKCCRLTGQRERALLDAYRVYQDGAWWNIEVYTCEAGRCGQTFIPLVAAP